MNRTLLPAPARRLASATRAIAKGLLGIALVALATLVFVPDVLAASAKLRGRALPQAAPRRDGGGAPIRGDIGDSRTRSGAAALAGRD